MLHPPTLRRSACLHAALSPPTELTPSAALRPPVDPPPAALSPLARRARSTTQRSSAPPARRRPTATLSPPAKIRRPPCSARSPAKLRRQPRSVQSSAGSRAPSARTPLAAKTLPAAVCVGDVWGTIRNGQVHLLLGLLFTIFIFLYQGCIMPLGAIMLELTNNDATKRSQKPLHIVIKT